MNNLRDLVFRISTAKYIKGGKWASVNTNWEVFSKMFEKTKRTAETCEQYHAKSKNAKKESKGTEGGYFPGWTSDGSRRGEAAVGCSILVFDIDDAKGKDVIEELKAKTAPDATSPLLRGLGWLAHTTHSHTPEAPRWRVIFPFSRAIEPDRYKPVAMAMAKALGLDQIVDTTGYDKVHAFFWPTAPSDAEYKVCQQGERPIDVDEVLKVCDEPQDVFQRPHRLHEDKGNGYGNEGIGGNRATADKSRPDRMEDPRTKSDPLISAFCRAYTIEDAIAKFLPDVYHRESDRRYTFVDGSTTGGLQIFSDYGGRLAKSWHGTDPAREGEVNAFDLVRIHKFGHLDETAKRSTPFNKLPSYFAMMDLCAEDPETGRERAAELDGIEADEVPDWKATLMKDHKGNYIKNLNNLHTIILNDPRFEGVRYDEFQRDDLRGDWGKGDTNKSFIGDEELWKMAAYIEKAYRINVNANAVRDALTATQAERGFHPIKDLIKAEGWDGTPRVETLLIRYLGAEDCALTRCITKKFITAMVARIFEPGCYFPQVLTLVGPKNIGKNTFFKALTSHKYVLENFSFDQLKDERRTIEQTGGKWVVDLSELGGIHTLKDWAQTKGYISATSSKARGAYKAKEEEVLRQFVLTATTNEYYFLKDPENDNRRWWIVEVKGSGDASQWFNALRAESPQIWAEAFHYYSAEGSAGLDRLPSDLLAQMEERQAAAATVADSTLKDAIVDLLLKKVPRDFDRKSSDDWKAYFETLDEGPAPSWRMAQMERQKATSPKLLYKLLPKPNNGGEITHKLIRGCLATIKGVVFSPNKYVEGLPFDYRGKDKGRSRRGTRGAYEITQEFFDEYGSEEDNRPEDYPAEEDEDDF